MPKIIDIIAPSGPVNPDVLPKIQGFLARMGFVARIPPNLQGPDLISANSDKVRLELLKAALFAEDSDFIWAVRGGCGATRLLPGLKGLAEPAKKKRLLGFSDITALHLFLSQKWGWQTVHGPTARQAVNHEISVASLEQMEQILQGKSDNLECVLHALNPAALQTEKIAGALTGGNLKLTESSLGTFWQIDTRDKILMLEDVNEKAYRVDRSLVHLQQAGLFNQARAVVFGDFNFDEQPEEVSVCNKVLTRFAEELNIPVFQTNCFGHGKENLSWQYSDAEINAGILRQ